MALLNPSGYAKIARRIMSAETPDASRDAARELCEGLHDWTLDRIIRAYFKPKDVPEWLFDLLADEFSDAKQRHRLKELDKQLTGGKS